MIRSFKDHDTGRIFQGLNVKKFSVKLCRQAQRKLLMIHASLSVRDLRIPPGNRLEKLAGKKDTYSIRIDDQWRVRFVWCDGHADSVEVVDYHL